MFDVILNFNNGNIKEKRKADLISIYRNSLMGIAILWIVFFHSEINFDKLGFLSYFPLFIKIIGYLGVDIFFFVSGFGLMAGWYKNRPKILFFYKRRFLRIMPIYWFFFTVQLILLSLFGGLWNLNTILIYSTGLSHFIVRFIGMTSGIHWFISALLLCYLMFPFFAKYFEKINNKVIFLIFTVGLCLTSAIFLSGIAFIFTTSVGFLLIIILRLPAFFMGSFIGYVFIKNDTNFFNLFSILYHAIFTLFCIVTLGLVFCFTNLDDRWSYGLYWYPFVFGSFSLTFLSSVFLDMLHKHCGHILILLNVIGKSSLELYFIHFLVFEYITKIQFFLTHFGVLLEGNYLWIIAIFISVSLSIIFNRIFQHIGLY